MLVLTRQARGKVLTPVHAVPAKAHAKGSMYQGEIEMRYTLSATLTTVVATAPHALNGLISNTCMQQPHTSQLRCQCWCGINTAVHTQSPVLRVPAKLDRQVDCRRPNATGTHTSLGNDEITWVSVTSFGRSAPMLL